jgi:hypothetical protein
MEKEKGMLFFYGKGKKGGGRKETKRQAIWGEQEKLQEGRRGTEKVAQEG